MRNSLILAVSVVAVFGGVFYFASRAENRTTPERAAAGPAPAARVDAPAPVPANTTSAPPAVSADRPAEEPVESENSRRAKMTVSPPNRLIEFVKGEDGKVVQEIDKDPGSAGFGKISREYLYLDERIVGVTAYKYLGDRVQITHYSGSYKPDGGIEQYNESTEDQEVQKAP